MTRTRRDDAADPDDVERRLDALAARHWSSAEELNRLTLGRGDGELTLYGSAAATAAFVDTLAAAGDVLHDARVEAARLRTRVEQLERAREVADERAQAARAGSHAAGAHASRAETRGSHTGQPRAVAAAARDRADGGVAAGALENVPASLIAPFHPDARTLASAKENPLVALAVQATKAMQPDAPELERARLLAMAYAASTGDLERFWTARAQRSAKKLQPAAGERKKK